MDASMEGKPNLLKELHRDLARKYQVHGTRIEQIWRSFSKNQREKALKAGAAEGQVLKDAKDRAMCNVYKIMPEWNLRDITEPGSDYLLDLLKHRATKSLCEQYREGVNGDQGDAAFISNILQSFGSIEIQRIMAGISVAVNAGVCVPQSTGELILERQVYTLQSLNILVEDILEGGSTSRNTRTRPKKPEEAARAALSTLSIVSKPEKLSLQDLLASALDQKASLEDYLNLCRTEPVLLAHVVNNWFFSRPELVQDEKGRTMPLVTDKYISIAMFEAIHNAVAGTAIWNYLYRLLQALADGPNDQVYRGIILQEMSNVCHLEYGRVQKLFKRFVQMGSGSKYFRRVSGVYDNGTARVTMKVKPEVLTREGPQVHYMLRLCQAETNVFKAIPWIKKLDDLHQSQPTERDNMEERELDAFGDLAVTAGFVQSLSTSLPLPPINLRKGQVYASKMKGLVAELDPLKTQIDLADYAAPIDNLMEPGMAEGALNALDRFLIDKTGTKIGILYQDLIEDCVSDIQNHYQQQKANIGQNAKTELAAPLAAPITETPSLAIEVQQRRQKDKTRQVHSSIYEIAPIVTPPQYETIEISPIFKVKQDTIKVFTTLFSKSKLRGSISWAAFEAAMTDLRFSVMPKVRIGIYILPSSRFRGPEITNSPSSPQITN